MKTCPYCAEEIQDVAVYCYHCHKDLEPKEPKGMNLLSFLHIIRSLIAYIMTILLVIGLFELFSGIPFWYNWGLQWFVVGMIVELILYGMMALIFRVGK